MYFSKWIFQLGQKTIGDCNYNTHLGSLLRIRFFGWRKQEGGALRCGSRWKERAINLTSSTVNLLRKWENIVRSWKKIRTQFLRFCGLFRKDITHFNVHMPLVTVALSLLIHSKCKVYRKQLLQLLTSLLKENCQHTFCCVNLWYLFVSVYKGTVTKMWKWRDKTRLPHLASLLEVD